MEFYDDSEEKKENEIELNLNKKKMNQNYKLFFKFINELSY